MVQRPNKNTDWEENHLFKSYIANGGLAVDRVWLPKAGAVLISIIKFLINWLNPHKALGYNRISIGMVKLCNLTITKPLSIICKNCHQLGVFPDDRKKHNIVPVH